MVGAVAASVGILPSAAFASETNLDLVVNGCTILANPTRQHHTICPGTSFDNVNFQPNLNLRYANLRSSTFEGANLSHANLSNAALFAVRFTHAVLRGDDFISSDLGAAKLSFVTADGSRFDNVHAEYSSALKSTFKNTDFSDADLKNSAFVDDDFFHSNMSYADFFLGKLSFKGPEDIEWRSTRCPKGQWTEPRGDLARCAGRFLGYET